MASIDEIQEFWTNTAPTPECCTTVFGKMASEHVATLLAEVKKLHDAEAEGKDRLWKVSAELANIKDHVLKSIIEAYKDVEMSPDQSLSSKDAWVVAAGYVAEFTCRELWRRNVITRNDAVPVFVSTGGDVEDPQNWYRK